MAAKYKIGQEVVIRPVKGQQLSPRDASLESYTGQVGKVANYYWISSARGTNVFYIYTVQIGMGHEEIVLHEDELEARIS